MKWWLGTLALLAIALALRLEYMVYAMYAFLAVLAWSRYSAHRSLARLEIERDCDRASAEIGDHARVHLVLRHRGRGRGKVPWLLVEEGLPVADLQEHPPRLRTQAPPLFVASLRPGESRDLGYDVEFLQRGYYQFGPVLLETGDLFGLYRRYRVASAPCFVLVRPRIVPLLGYDLASRRPVGEVRISHRFFEDPTRITGIRPYQPGDALHRIHWRATARTGELHSKVYEPSCVAGATLLLDFHRDGYTRPRRQPVLSPTLARQLAAAGADTARLQAEFEGPHSPWIELAITTAASLAHAICEEDRQVGLVTNGRDAADRVRVEGWRHEFRSRALARDSLLHRPAGTRRQPVTVETRRDPRQLSLLLDTLARLEVTDGFSFPDLVAETASRLPRDATVAAILPNVSEATAIALGNLRRAGYAVTAIVVSVEENDLHDWANPPEWAARLVAEGIPFRRVQDEAGIENLCAEHFLR